MGVSGLKPGLDSPKVINLVATSYAAPSRPPANRDLGARRPDLPGLSRPESSPKAAPLLTRRQTLLLLGIVAGCIMVGAAIASGVVFLRPKSHPIAAWPSSNPVLDQNFPDPFVLHEDGRYYAFATNDYGSNVQTAVSTNLLDWDLLDDALPTVPSWSSPHWVWAPNVHVGPSGNHVMVFATRYNQGNDTRMAVGMAISSSGPAGPYVPVRSNSPFVDMPSEGGAIDPSHFADDDGKQYLVWKSDGNAVQASCAIWCQSLSADGLTLTGEPWPLIRNDQDWEHGVIEAPNLIKRNGIYYLYYSAGAYFEWTYTVAYATSSSILGPFTKQGQVLKTTAADGLVGPGKSCTVHFTRNATTTTWMVFHSLYFLQDRSDPRITYRAMDILPMSYDDRGKPQVQTFWGDSVNILKNIASAPATAPGPAPH